MKIEDLVQILTNRLREFKLSKDYARMSGDLERMNTADKEIIALEDTLYKLNLLVDASKSAAVKDTTLTEVMTDGSVAVLGKYDISPYATDPEHEEKITSILSKMGLMDTTEKIDDYIKGKYESSPVTGEMIMSAAQSYEVDVRLMMAIMELDSRFGTAGIAVGTLNPGNVGNNDDGNTRTYGSWQEGVTAVAEWLNRHRTTTPTVIIQPETSTTTPTVIITPETATTTTPTVIIQPETSTTTPEAIIPPEIAPITPEVIAPTETAPTIPEVVIPPEITPIPEVIVPTETAPVTSTANYRGIA